MAKTAAADPAIAFIFKRPFAEQVAFFRGKLGNLVPTARWDDIWKSAHDRAFMVAGAAKADLLADLAEAVDKAIADGETLDKFRERFADIVQKHGWHGWTGEATEEGRAWRTRIIYQTNLFTSYAAGRLAQLRDAGYRYWIYRHTPQEHPRLHHLAWDGMMLPANHPFWQTHYPPNGFGCKCRVVGANGPETAKLVGGKPGYTEPPAGWDEIDPKTGEQVGIDKGWGYMPGGTSDLVREIERKAAKLPKPLGEALALDIGDRGKVQPSAPRTLDEFISAGRELAASLPDPDSDPQGAWEAIRGLYVSGVESRVDKGSGKMKELVRRVTRIFPAKWVEAANSFGTLDVRFSQSRGSHYLTQTGSAIVARDEANMIHEFAHRIQSALPELDAIFHELHKRRTDGETLRALRYIDPSRNYRRDEFARPDNYVEPYMGKEYRGRGALELFPMAMEYVLGATASRAKGWGSSEEFFLRLVRDDPELFWLVLGVLKWFP
jgi:hypothetical protein